MLGSLLKAGWQSDSAVKRRSAILKMNVEDDANQVIFENLALSDSNQDVRLACIEQLRAAVPLFRVYQESSEETSKSAAKIAFCALIGTDSKLELADFEVLLSQHSAASTLVAQYCPYCELRERLINSLSQTKQAEIIANIHFTQTRLHIAKQLNEVDALEIARRNLKGKDKNSEKVIRAKLEKIRAQQKLEDDTNNAALDLSEQMEFIANHPEWRSEFKDKYEQVTQRWTALTLSPRTATLERFTTASQLAKKKVDAQTKRERAEQKQIDIVNNLEDFCQTLAPFPLSKLGDQSLNINSTLNNALASWLEQAEQTGPSTELAQKFLAAQEALSNLSDLVEITCQEDINAKALASKLQNIKWPAHYSRLTAKSEAQAQLDQLQKQHSDQKKQFQEQLDKLHKRINRLLGTSNKGNVKQAKHELSATTKAASHYSGKERAVLDERLAMANDIVTKMSDWQNFAIEPKLVSLCESMEQLVESKTHPDKLAKQIAKLQSRWKNLGHTDISDDYWLRFKAAADLAYAPCATFFDQRRATQKDNLSKREPLVTQMQLLLEKTDWENSPDYKKIEQNLRQINNDWRKIKDVEHKAGQKQWNKLCAIRDSIYQNLDIVYDANFEQKKQLIDKVNQLTSGCVNEDSLDKLKLFQNRWKQVGITRRKQDQDAWIKFKAAGDTLFEKVKDVRTEKRAIEDEQIGAYKDIIAKIHALAKSATHLPTADAEFDELNSAYKSLPSLPRALPEKLIERLESDFKRAGNAFSQSRDRVIQASKDDVISKLNEKARLCGQLEAAIVKQDTDSACKIEQQLNDIIIIDKFLDTRFQARLNAAHDTDKSAANQARSLLCIDLEILLDIPSPENDKAQRMQIQLERMKSVGIGHSPIEQKSAIAELKLDWLCSPGAEPDLQRALEKRFVGLIKKVN